MIYKRILFTTLILFFTSCKKNEIEREIKDIYIEFSKRENHSIKIEEIEILETKNVTNDYYLKIQINSLNYAIELSKQNIVNSKKIIELLGENINERNKLIKINGEKKEKYKADNEYDESEIEREKLEIKNTENQIATIKHNIALKNTELNEKEDKENQLVEYIFKGEIFGNQRVDTLKLLFHIGNEPKFIKNDKFINYQMIIENIQYR